MKTSKAVSSARKTRQTTIEVTTGDPDLAALADRINDSYDKAGKSAGAALKYAIEVGMGLVEAKRVVPHGAWLAWLETHFEFSARTAAAYMRIARLHPMLGGNEQCLANFESISKAIAALAKPHLRKLDDAERDGSAGDDRDDGQRAEDEADSESETDEGSKNDEGSENAETEDTEATNAEAEEGTADGDAETQTDEESSGQGDEQYEEEAEDDQAAADRHRERCDRLRRIEAGSVLKPADKKLHADVQRGLQGFIGAVVELALQHGRRLCEEAGGDMQLAAMLFVSLAKQAADPEADFGPTQEPQVLHLDPGHDVPSPAGARSRRKPRRSSGRFPSDGECLG